MIDSDGNAKLADFGSAKMFPAGDDTLKGSVGTYHFFAPEMCDEKVNDYSGCAVDVWALGISLYALVYNKLPHKAPSEIELLEAINAEEITFTGRNCSEGLNDLLKRMLDKNPKTRITLQEIKAHAWINDGYGVNLS